MITQECQRIQVVYRFPVEPPRESSGHNFASLDVLAHVLTDAANIMLRLVSDLPECWSTLPERDREWLHSFAIGPSGSFEVSEKDKRIIYDLLIAYQDVVSEFIKARLKLLKTVTALRSKDIWESALSDNAFVKAAIRGTTALQKGEVTAVSWDEL